MRRKIWRGVEGSRVLEGLEVECGVKMGALVPPGGGLRRRRSVMFAIDGCPGACDMEGCEVR